MKRVFSPQSLESCAVTVTNLIWAATEKEAGANASFFVLIMLNCIGLNALQNILYHL